MQVPMQQGLAALTRVALVPLMLRRAMAMSLNFLVTTPQSCAWLCLHRALSQLMSEFAAYGARRKTMHSASKECSMRMELGLFASTSTSFTQFLPGATAKLVFGALQILHRFLALM